jgi:hypothetical protein
VPLDVTTTSPFAKLPLDMGLVVTFSPSRNSLDPLIKPVTALSCPIFQRSIVGTPLGASFFVDAADVDILVAGTEDPVLNIMESNDMVGDVLLVIAFTGLVAGGFTLGIFAGEVVFFPPSSPNPNNIEESDIVTPGEAFSADFSASFCFVF